MIQVENFYKDYFSVGNKTPVFSVQDISIVVNKSSITGLLGPNGSGKTTLMNAICGFHYSTKGNIFVSDFDGKLINVSDYPELIPDLIGYVPEKSILPPDLYVKEFLLYTAELHNLKGAELDKAINNVSLECSLQEKINQKIKTLSKGYLQRVSFAQAIIHNPPNLILDEPISGLDPAQIIQMRTLIQKMAKDKAVLMSTHILQEVYSLCNNIYVISKGKLVCDGNEKEILTKTKTSSLEDAFLKLTK